MSLAITITAIFLMLIGFGLMYIGFKRNAVTWFIVATVIFITNAYFCFTIPFVTNVGGEVILQRANVVLFGVNVIFAFIGLVFSFSKAMALLDIDKIKNYFQ